MQRFEIHISDKIFKFDKSKLDKKDKKSYKSRKNSADFLLSRSIKSRIKKRGKFCISHKKFDRNLQNFHIAAVGFSNKKFGIDLEILAERDFDSVIDFCFNEFEKNLMQICDKSEKTILFYQIYTIKEAIIKLENLAFSDLARVGLSTNQNEIKAKNHKGKFINFKTYLLYNRFLISVCFKE
ncbi:MULTISPECIES: 4'-phosphopantetheinyl transferase superfamily protein [unclassified Campylobacter]|uniref:4'-phosphopantetheinyl transferase superfamily protein n=1 Tax=unclassified Campylobacter TaxID=2593542 RepID=UPI0022E9BA7E|nr:MULTISPECIES: 4'-phosphopantetheinyl transferase superfamily protein [unclassified Campylobacter]MDA3055918.1 4'-phosphopantetheinyl transferase superfamily protein [Campylobacter sp. CN_NA1]MDA3066124.1 4'-phosphopantetheinyl transferase superfamily protein [Campylobacter sp. CN_NE4]MDA3069403.1 4'-phosphopantetheinyl transferase superfamily protein [Campylobacter sp. CN_NE3]MDA3082517.1 4'-phosphopantetheinyl transferase superfamily protein [Campylobacter sp. CN_EL2]MDA3083745.1 4'-phosph